ncbi:MAG: hypothetical protein IIB56_14995 [Planctomycetes bacterium]|nr:hypothetical protein [Planctomycetota bacterium]
MCLAAVDFLVAQLSWLCFSPQDTLRRGLEARATGRLTAGLEARATVSPQSRKGRLAADT